MPDLSFRSLSAFALCAALAAARNRLCEVDSFGPWSAPSSSGGEMFWAIDLGTAEVQVQLKIEGGLWQLNGDRYG